MTSFQLPICFPRAFYVDVHGNVHGELFFSLVFLESLFCVTQAGVGSPSFFPFHGLKIVSSGYLLYSPQDNLDVSLQVPVVLHSPNGFCHRRRLSDYRSCSLVKKFGIRPLLVVRCNYRILPPCLGIHDNFSSSLTPWHSTRNRGRNRTDNN